MPGPKKPDWVSPFVHFKNAHGAVILKVALIHQIVSAEDGTRVYVDNINYRLVAESAEEVFAKCDAKYQELGEEATGLEEWGRSNDLRWEKRFKAELGDDEERWRGD